MVDLATQYNYAVYVEIVYGQKQYQAHGVVMVDNGEGAKIELWLPLDVPRATEEDAKLDCYTAHKALIERQLAKATDYRLDPNLRRHDWSGTRRILI